MATKDLQVRKGVRAVLARHWIDPDKIQLMVSRGGVRLTGELRCLPAGGRRQLDLQAVNQILLELRRLPDVGRVQVELIVEGPGGRRRRI